MATILSYDIEYENSYGEMYEAEVNINCNNLGKIHESEALDETARRFLIGKIIEQGGRVIKIRKISGLV